MRALQQVHAIFSEGAAIHFHPDAFEPNETQGNAVPLPVTPGPVHLTFFNDPEGDHSGGGTADTDRLSLTAYGGQSNTNETTTLHAGQSLRLRPWDGKSPPPRPHAARTPHGAFCHPGEVGTGQRLVAKVELPIPSRRREAQAPP